MAFKAVVWTCSVDLFLDIETKEFAKLDSIFAFFWRKFLLWWTARCIHPHDMRVAVPSDSEEQMFVLLSSPCEEIKSLLKTQW